MKTLLFQVNVHRTEPFEIPGHGLTRAINLTVRKGLKWSDLKVGEVIKVAETGHKCPDYTNDGTPPSGAAMPELKCDCLSATIYDVKVMPFNALMNYPRMLKLEHDPKCQSYTGLFETMRKVYDGFLQHELVTLVFYEVC